MSRVLFTNIHMLRILTNGSTGTPLHHLPSRTFFSRIRDRNKPKVAVVHLCGTIQANLGGRNNNSLNLESTREHLDSAFKIKGLKELCLVVNSPGGSPVQSELICNRIQHLSTTKKVNVVSFVEDYAASGGYWLACAADEIYCAESSVVGSIGVIGSSFGFEKVLQRWDVERRVARMGRNKDINDPFLPETDEKKEITQRTLSKMYTNFQEHVKKRRGERLTADDDTLFTGEYWVGQDAVDLGLVDGVRTLNDYLYERYQDEVKVHRFGHKKKRLLSTLFGSSFGIPSVGDVLDDLWHEKYKIR